ncbi:MAG: AAA family ATPase [Chitinophagales bacterium]
MRNHIKSLRLINFQSHRDSKFEFLPGLNIILGPSDQGKTSIIRALRWLAFNEPRGSSFIRVGESICRVLIELNNGIVIERIRDDSGKVNRYILEIPGQKTQVFEKFSKDVPLEVKKALGIRKLNVDRDKILELNLARQMEAPFLLEESGSMRSKALGRVANLHIIDAAQREVIRDINQISQETGRLEKEVLELQERLEQYSGLKKEEETLTVIEQLMQEGTRLEKLAETLQGQKNRWDECQGNLNEAVKLMVLLDGIDSATNHYEEIVCLNSILSEITSIKMRLQAITGEMAEVKSILDSTMEIENTERILDKLKKLRLEGFELQELRKRIREMQADQERKKLESKESDKILKLLSGLDELEQVNQDLINKTSQLAFIVQLQSERDKKTGLLAQDTTKIHDTDILIAHLAEEYGKLLIEIGRCPTCMSEINSETVARIHRELIN